MARKTNKTAHVLNLLSGNAAHKGNTPEEKATVDEKQSILEKPAPAEKNTRPAGNVQMDTRDGEDPVSDIIKQQLIAAFESDMLPEQQMVSKETSNAKESSVKEEQAADETPTIEEAAGIEEVPVSEPTAVIEEMPVSEPTTIIEKTSVSEPASVAEEIPETKEPEFILLNVMEEIVRHKIIYFMRQFEVCTCDRCVADTIALTLNGLSPKYIVTPPAAAAPLTSFYTNKYISDITVEATKACMAIKENPRH